MKAIARNTWPYIVLLSALATPGLVRADEEPARQLEAADKAVKVFQSFQDAQRSSPFGSQSPGGPMTFFSGGGRAGSNVSATIRKAAEAVRDAKGDEAKSDAKKKLVDLLNKCYDEDMEQREKELKQIEERLAKLREQLARRREKKQDIIDLQVKVALNEADGLGFYDGERGGKFRAGNVEFDTRVIAAPPQPPAPVAAPAPIKVELR